jgi:hypothetical protein
MQAQIKRDGASLGRGRTAKRKLGVEEGSGAAMRLCGASPEKYGRATSGGAKSSIDREVGEGLCESVKRTRNHPSLK